MEALSMLDEAGFVEVPGVLASDQGNELMDALNGACFRRAGSRNQLDVPVYQRLAETFRAHPKIGAVLPRGNVAVQCTLFEKSARNNWLVAWHQDVSIPVQERVSDSNCSRWSEDRKSTPLNSS